MTKTERIAAGDDIMRNIAQDVENNPNFTMTRSQLRARITTYCDNPDTTPDDLRRIFSRLVCDPSTPIRATRTDVLNTRLLTS
jgi:hypothetical protein